MFSILPSSQQETPSPLTMSTGPPNRAQFLTVDFGYSPFFNPFFRPPLFVFFQIQHTGSSPPRKVLSPRLRLFRLVSLKSHVCFSAPATVHPFLLLLLSVAERVLPVCVSPRCCFSNLWSLIMTRRFADFLHIVPIQPPPWLRGVLPRSRISFLITLLQSTCQFFLVK